MIKKYLVRVGILSVVIGIILSLPIGLVSIIAGINYFARFLSPIGYFLLTFDFIVVLVLAAFWTDYDIKNGL